MNCSRMPTAVMASALIAISAAKGNWLRAAPRRDRMRESKTVCTAHAVKPTLPPCAALRRKFARLFSPAGSNKARYASPAARPTMTAARRKPGRCLTRRQTRKAKRCSSLQSAIFAGELRSSRRRSIGSSFRLACPRRGGAVKRPDGSAPTIFPDQRSPFLTLRSPLRDQHCASFRLRSAERQPAWNLGAAIRESFQWNGRKHQTSRKNF